MVWVEATVLAIALAIDAAAVAAALGASGSSTSAVLRSAVAFGLAQSAMAGLGAIGGAQLASFASGWDHWVAFGLLVVVGAKMALEEPEESPRAPDPTAWALVGMALATSIDALVAGVALPALDLPVGISVGIIGLVTAILAVVAGRVGQAAGRLAGPWAMRGAGVVLIALGCRVLWLNGLATG